MIDTLPAARRSRFRRARLSHVLIMAFDGFAIYRHLHPGREPVDEATINAMAALLLGE